MAGWPRFYGPRFSQPVLSHLWTLFLLWRHLDKCQLGAHSCPLYKWVSRNGLSKWKSKLFAGLLNFRKAPQSIWAHLGKVNRKSITEGLVVQIYRLASNCKFCKKGLKNRQFYQFQQGGTSKLWLMAYWAWHFASEAASGGEYEQLP